MARPRIDLMELQQLIQLKSKGYSNRKVGRELGISRNTVNSYVTLFNEQGLSYEELAGYNEKQLRELFASRDAKQTDRYETLTGFFPYMQKELAKPGCTLQALWRQYLQTYPGGYGYTQFTTYFNRWAKTTKASGILAHQVGRHLFIDFAGKKLEYVDRQSGQVIPVDVFVGILPCSQYTFVWACRSQKREELIDALNRCLRFLGGVPKAIVSDNMKAAVARGHRYAPAINKTIKAFGLHYDTILDSTRPDKRHMPSTHREYGDWSPAYFRRRAWKVGPYTARYIERLMGQYKFPEWAYKQAQGILAQGAKYGNNRLEAAGRRALAVGTCSFRTIEQILKNRQDQALDLFASIQSSIPDHDNIRGAGYYQ